MSGHEHELEGFLINASSFDPPAGGGDNIDDITAAAKSNLSDTVEQSARPGDGEQCQIAPEAELNYRRWLRGTVLMVLCVGAFLGISLLINPNALKENRVWLLLPLIFVYFSLATTFLPLPTAPLIMLAAGPDIQINPLLLALVCTAGTGLANLHDYYLLSFLYRYKRVQQIRNTRLYEKAAAWFDRAPFITLSAASFLPIPIDLVRLLAISQRYPRVRFALASVLGRFPRYLIIALVTDRFDLGLQWVLAALAVTVLLGLGRVLPQMVRKLSTRKEGSEA